MVIEIMRAIDGAPNNMGIEDGYEEDGENFEVARSHVEDRVDCMERPMEDKVGWLDRFGAQLKLKHKMDVSNFLGTLNPEDMIDWIGELEDYFELEDIGDLLRLRLAQTKLKGNASLWWKELQREREEEGEMS